MKLEILIMTETTKRHTVKLTGAMITNMVAAQLGKKVGACRVFTMVPRSGDHSGMELDIDDECPVYVTWETTKVEDTRD